MLPNRISLSQLTTDKLRYMKQNTGLTPNVLCRIAIMLTIREGGNLENAGALSNDGQVLSRDVLFGDHSSVYEVLINQYLHSRGIELPVAQAIPAMIEIGVYKMGHVKKVGDLVF